MKDISFQATSSSESSSTVIILSVCLSVSVLVLVVMTIAWFFGIRQQKNLSAQPQTVQPSQAPPQQAPPQQAPPLPARPPPARPPPAQPQSQQTRRSVRLFLKKNTQELQRLLVHRMRIMGVLRCLKFFLKNHSMFFVNLDITDRFFVVLSIKQFSNYIERKLATLYAP